MKKITVFAPASASNVNCGFDVLGFALEDIGDSITLTKTETKGIRITAIEGAELPLEIDKNVAGVAATAMLEALDLSYGFDIALHKGIPVGSGIGGSAASAAAVVFGINQFLETPLSLLELAHFAMKGEALASGGEHADNIAPSLFGGFTLIPSYDPFTVVGLPVPSNLYVTIVKPNVEIKTKEAREILPEKVSLASAVKHSGNLAGFVSGLYTDNYQLIGQSAEDILIEPFRKELIPLFDKARNIALRRGALTFGISGSGPAMFALSEGLSIASEIEQAVAKFYTDLQLNPLTIVCRVSPKGCRVISKE